MSRLLRLAAGAAALVVVMASAPRAATPHLPTVAQFLKPGLPIELVSARKSDRIAWIAYDGRGARFPSCARDSFSQG
jgi:uncharacterized membrane protein